MALTRAAAAVTSRTVRKVTTTHGAVPVVTTKSRGASRVTQAGRGSWCHVYYSRIQKSWLEGSIVTFVESITLLTFRLWKGQALKIVVLVHGFILGKAGSTRKIASMEFGPFESMGLWVSRGTMLQATMVRV